MAVAPLANPVTLGARTATRPPLRLLSTPHDGGRAAAQVVGVGGPVGRAKPRGRLGQRALVLVAAGLVAALGAPIGALAGASGGPGGALMPGATYVVGPGDTLASIAARLAPGDPGPLVAKMAAETGSQAVVPGEHLVLP